jgi:hypothetical protein
MNRKKKSQLKSNCCNSIVRTEGGGDFGKQFEGTFYYVCNKCRRACDVHLDDRKTWEINPKTRIVPNKKKKNEKLFTDKELKKFREEEDY